MRMTRSALRETAGLLLAELEEKPGESLRNAGEEAAVDTDIFDEKDTFGAIYCAKRYKALCTAGTSLEAYGLSDETAAALARRQPALSEETEATLARRRPALSAEFLRKPGGRAAGSTAADAAGAAILDDVRKNELTDTDTPARLSEIFRRDARCYDGPFERY